MNYKAQRAPSEIPAISAEIIAGARAQFGEQSDGNQTLVRDVQITISERLC